MYFKSFPKIPYDIDKSDGTYSLINVVDITKNVRVIKKVLENITLYDEYDMMDGETVELVAEKIYGNPELHWIIMLVNERYDYLRDFPMSIEELDEYVEEKYGSTKFNIKHYEQNGLITEARATLKVPASTIGTDDNQFKVTDFITGPTGAAKVESINQQTSTLNILLDQGNFIAGQQCVVSGFRLDEDVSTDPSTFSWKYRGFRFNFIVPQNALFIPDVYIPVTNYDYENTLNEGKRRIKLIAPELAQQFIREFETLIAR